MKNRKIRLQMSFYIILWVFIAAISIDELKLGFILLSKESYYSASVSIIIGLTGIGVGIWRILRHTYQWDLEKGRVKRYIKLLR
ncbi:hypothetical protein ACHOLT_04460 [Desulfitobacterium sp. Sab5]|uniref:hypothetical protein n=1 Tax=Desulfitobacterium nosdiversum TaxID=3375356 RepID=UPI003CF81D97